MTEHQLRCLRLQASLCPWCGWKPCVSNCQRRARVEKEKQEEEVTMTAKEIEALEYLGKPGSDRFLEGVVAGVIWSGWALLAAYLIWRFS